VGETLRVVADARGEPAEGVAEVVAENFTALLGNAARHPSR
jgi:hypothetical protein